MLVSRGENQNLDNEREVVSRREKEWLANDLDFKTKWFVGMKSACDEFFLSATDAGTNHNKR
jgi:hypothetical protein